MTLKTRLGLASLAALLPLAALAVTPPNVSGISASVENGKVVVSWTPVEGSVKNYRVFYSHASILEQGGVYDDYEDAPGNVTTYTLLNVPPVDTLYVSVLAVSQDGTESSLFMEETNVALAGGTIERASSSMQAASSQPNYPISSNVLRLLEAESTSQTGVTLIFTHEVSIPQQYAMQAFVIKTASGSPLPIVRYKIQGNRVHLDTDYQDAGRVYQVSVHPSITGKAPTGNVPQEEGTAPLLFTGLLQDLILPDVSGLTLKAFTVGKTKTVEASWVLPAKPIREIQLQQSNNGGVTYGAPIRMDKASKGASIPNVTGASFTLLIRTVGLDGSLSRGVKQTVTFTGAQTSSTKSVAATSARTTSKSSTSSQNGSKPGKLPNSGLGIAVVIGLSGAATGMRMIRRKKA